MGGLLRRLKRELESKTNKNKSHQPDIQERAAITIKKLARNTWEYFSVFSGYAHRVWKILLEIAAVAGLLALLYPRVSVSSTTSINPDHPFATPFSVANNGLFPVYDVEFSCGMNDVSTESTPHQLSQFSTVFASLPIPRINGGHSEITFCAFPFITESPIKEADISVSVHFKSAWLPPKRTEIYRFRTIKGTDGRLYWYPKAE